MKKIWGWIAGVVIVAAIAAYVIWNNATAMQMSDNSDGSTANNATTTDIAGAGGSIGITTIGSGTVTVTPVGSGGATGSAGQYKDGTYTGPVENAVYGQLQVVVTVSGGKIVDTNCPIQPNAPGHTTEVSGFALPQLKQEAIASQSANVAIVSGATQDSQAFQASLAAALVQAKA